MIVTRLMDGIESLLRLVVFVIYVAIVAIVAFQVANRFWLHWPIVWLSDLAIILFIWLGFLTAALAVRLNAHFRLNLMLDLVGETWARRLLELFSHLLMLTVFGLMIVTGYQMARLGLREVSPGLQVTMTWAYASIPIPALFAVLFALEAAMNEITGENTRRRQKARDLLQGAS